MSDHGRTGRPRIGIFDHTGYSLGGAQLVVGRAAAVLSHYYDVDLIHSGTKPILGKRATSFCLDLGRVRERLIPLSPETFSIPGTTSFLEQMSGDLRLLSRPYDLFIYSGHGVPPFCYARHGLVYCHFPIESSPEESLKGDARWMCRSAIDRRIRGSAYGLLWRIRMKGYSKILANSSFTATWIERRWGKAAEVLYPPVELSIPAVEKRNLIVSVGRFTGSHISKEQLGQVSAFREFLAQVSGDWSLCLIGSCGDSAGDRAYLEAVQRAAQGLPVAFLVDANRKAVCWSLGEAKLFWHAAGLSVDETEFPQRMEHFGIATVEAMRAGCVPIVIDSGGQREIVENNVGGFLCKDLPELVQRSVALAQEESRRCTMSERAKQRSMDFTGDVFDRQLLKIVSQCLELK